VSVAVSASSQIAAAVVAAFFRRFTSSASRSRRMASTREAHRMSESANLSTKDSQQRSLIFRIRAISRILIIPLRGLDDGALCCSLLRYDAPLVRHDEIIPVIL
jgi:hypothetical protein